MSFNITQNNPTFRERLSGFFGWGLGLFVIFAAVMVCRDGAWFGGLFLFVAAIVTLPPTQHSIREKLPANWRVFPAAIIFMALAMSGAVLSQQKIQDTKAKEMADDQESAEEVRWSEFEEARSELLKQIDDLTKAGDFQRVYDIEKKYYDFADDEFRQHGKVAVDTIDKKAQLKYKEEVRVRDEDDAKEYIQEVTNELRYLKRPPTPASVISEKFMAIPGSYNMDVSLLNKAVNLDLSASQKKIVEALKEALIQRQRYDFPKLRKAYCDYWNKKLWLEDAAAETLGADHKIIEFRGNKFLLNRSKSQFTDMHRSDFILYRFSQARYKWVQHDTQYTYFKLDSPKDSDIVEADDGLRHF